MTAHAVPVPVVLSPPTTLSLPILPLRPGLVLSASRSCRPWGSPTTPAVSAVSSVTSVWMGCPSPWTQRTRSTVSEITTSKEGWVRPPKPRYLRPCEARLQAARSAGLRPAEAERFEGWRRALGSSASRCLCGQEVLKDPRLWKKQSRTHSASLVSPAAPNVTRHRLHGPPPPGVPGSVPGTVSGVNRWALSRGE